MIASVYVLRTVVVLLMNKSGKESRIYIAIFSLYSTGCCIFA